MAGSQVGQLKLTGKARDAAEALKDKSPDVVFTSGRRDVAGQASAMAGNVVKQHDWIEKTYRASKASKACQKWVDECVAKNPKPSREDIRKGLLEVLKGLGTDVGQISKHLSGQAFDIAPNSAKLADVKAIAKKFNGRFLDHEGKLCRWHVQF